MQFLKTLFWVLVAVIVTFFAYRNWTAVTLNLWGDIQADIKIPILLLVFFLIGFLPTWLVMRARIWSYRRRLDALERTRAWTAAAPVPNDDDREPVG
jgi:putative membrane protein